MESRIQKWGNSLAVRIPKPLAKEAGLEESACVELTVKNGQIFVTRIADPVPSMKELLARVTDQNIHLETDWGVPVGNEIW